MRFVLILALNVSLLTAIGCSNKGKTDLKEATEEEIRMQKESEQRVRAEESQKRKNEPPSRQQTVKDQEAARQKR